MLVKGLKRLAPLIAKNLINPVAIQGFFTVLLDFHQSPQGGGVRRRVYPDFKVNSVSKFSPRAVDEGADVFDRVQFVTAEVDEDDFFGVGLEDVLFDF